MARLIPKISIDEISNKPERDVARALVEQLDSNCVIYHSYPWLRATRNDKNGNTVLQEGEVDFVIVDPNVGILILEVKGGDINYDPSSRRWYRLVGSANRDITDPFSQASRNMHCLVDKIVKRSFPSLSSPPFAYGYAVMFPDCVYQGDLPPGSEHAIILSSPDLNHINKRIREALRLWDRNPISQKLSRDALDGIFKALSPSFQLMPVLYRQIEEQEERIVRLTEEQKRLLNFLQNHPRTAIQGVAGSGKTMLALAQTQRFADQGMNTLFVCFNKALANWVDSSLPESSGKLITARNFHGLCHDFCVKAGITFTVPSENASAFWQEKAPELLIQALGIVDTRFDALVVDEGQDFHETWWVTLSEIQRDNSRGPLFVFYDPDQNIFDVAPSSLPDLGPVYPLQTNCRNTRHIADFCSNIQGIPIETLPGAPEGISCEFTQAKTPEEQRVEVQKLVKAWIKKGQLKASQVAILSPHSKSRSSLADIKEILGISITESHELWRENQGVLFSSIRAFKGLEADAVILIDIPSPGSIPTFNSNDFYVAASRPKHMLAILFKYDFTAEMYTSSKTC